jgi:formiminotetrahydrofolate cyclodeaminase
VRRRACVLTGFLDEVASTQSVPAGGSVAAATVAMASALLEKAAKLSRDHWTAADANAAATRAEAVRLRAASLVEEDAEAYRALQLAWRSARAVEPAARDDIVGPALMRVIDIPLAIVRAGAVVVELAEAVTARGNPRLRADAVMAGVLAAAAAEGAASLVAINLARDPDDPRVAEARALAHDAMARSEALKI